MMKRYFKYLGWSYLTAAVFELIANTVGDGKLLRNPAWPVYFVLWYGAIYSLLYFLFRNRPLWSGIVFFAIFGSIAEIVVFHRSNLIVDPIIYALMGFVPLWFDKKSVGVQ